jgi:phage shock protein PspC (stress-responsive transcriptional regulator)
MKDTGAFVAGIVVGIIGWIVLAQTPQGRNIRDRVEQTVDGFVDGVIEGLGQREN